MAEWEWGAEISQRNQRQQEELETVSGGQPAHCIKCPPRRIFPLEFQTDCTFNCREKNPDDV